MKKVGRLGGNGKVASMPLEKL